MFMAMPKPSEEPSSCRQLPGLQPGILTGRYSCAKSWMLAIYCLLIASLRTCSAESTAASGKTSILAEGLPAPVQSKAIAVCQAIEVPQVVTVAVEGGPHAKVVVHSVHVLLMLRQDPVCLRVACMLQRRSNLQKRLPNPQHKLVAKGRKTFPEHVQLKCRKHAQVRIVESVVNMLFVMLAESGRPGAKLLERPPEPALESVRECKALAGSPCDVYLLVPA